MRISLLATVLLTVSSLPACSDPQSTPAPDANLKAEVRTIGSEIQARRRAVRYEERAAELQSELLSKRGTTDQRQLRERMRALEAEAVTPEMRSRARELVDRLRQEDPAAYARAKARLDEITRVNRARLGLR